MWRHPGWALIEFSAIADRAELVAKIKADWLGGKLDPSIEFREATSEVPSQQIFNLDESRKFMFFANTNQSEHQALRGKRDQQSNLETNTWFEKMLH